MRANRKKKTYATMYYKCYVPVGSRVVISFYFMFYQEKGLQK